jgi:hypothetical protein
LYSYEKIDLGDYRGNTYFLAGFVVPDPYQYDEYNPDKDADEYGVTLVCSAETPTSHNTEIVRLDNAHGQTPHVDNLYLPPDSREDEKIELGDDWTYSKMRRYLLSKWRDYADFYSYYRNR